MKIGPKYKIARRLGVPVFEKTQTQKFAQREQRKQMANRTRRRGNRSDYALQLLEKQKARYVYGLSERQFRNYVRSAMENRKLEPIQALFGGLEHRLDNIVYRAGFAPTRRSSRQYVSHGHFTIGGKKITIPSYEVKDGTEISVRKGSKESGIFTDLTDRVKNTSSVDWIKPDVKKMTIAVSGEPTLDTSELLFDIRAVLEFYSR